MEPDSTLLDEIFEAGLPNLLFFYSFEIGYISSTSYNYNYETMDSTLNTEICPRIADFVE